MFSINKCLLIFAVSYCAATANAKRSFYDYTIPYADGYKPASTTSSDDESDKAALSLESLKGKVVLVVNVASKCGYTDADYKFLTELHNELAPSGQFEVLAFPCNQFGGQEPWQEEEIVVRSYALKTRLRCKHFLYRIARCSRGTSTAPTSPS